MKLPVRPPEDRLAGPHGPALITTQCEVLADLGTGGALPEGWTTLRYRWISSFNPQDKTRGPAARDTVTEEELVLLEATEPGKLRPVWHARFETGDYAIWRSITPEIVRTRQGTTLLSVMSCVNGTGGCGQEFLQRQTDGRWREVRQAWLDQLPAGFKGRIRHGVRIDIQSLKGEAGFYGDNDPNCCPSQVLKVDLALRDDSLVLLRQIVVSER